MVEAAPATRRRLVEDHLDYVRILAAQVHREIDRGVDLDELIAYGRQGLVEAADRYDPGVGAAFKTFAYYRIRGAIYDGLRKLGWLGRAEYARWRFESGANDYLRASAERDAAADAAGGAAAGAARRSGPDEVGAVARAVDGLAAIFVTSLEALPEGTQLAERDDEPLDEALGAGEEAAQVRVALARLPDKEREILAGHYFQGLSLQDAGKRLGLSKSWASRLHARAVDLLAAELRRLQEQGSPATLARRGR